VAFTINGYHVAQYSQWNEWWLDFTKQGMRNAMKKRIMNLKAKGCQV
jgi:hypothetical protein